MPYPYVTLLELIHIAIIVVLEIALLYILIKHYNKSAEIKSVLKSFFLYSAIAVLGLFLFSLPLFSELFDFNFKGIIIIVGLFLSFYYALNRFLLINWKKSLVIFFICFFIGFPLISGFATFVIRPLWNTSLLEGDIEKLLKGFMSPTNELASNGEFMSFINPTMIYQAGLLHPWNIAVLNTIERGLNGASQIYRGSIMFSLSDGIVRLLEILKPRPY